MAEYIDIDHPLIFKDIHNRDVTGTIRTILKANHTELVLADVAPVRHGHWILYKETVETTVFAGGHIYGKGDVVPYGYVCSECGRWEDNKEPFCNCGAKMDIEEDTDG